MEYVDLQLAYSYITPCCKGRPVVPIAHIRIWNDKGPWFPPEIGYMTFIFYRGTKDHRYVLEIRNLDERSLECNESDPLSTTP